MANENVAPNAVSRRAFLHAAAAGIAGIAAGCSGRASDSRLDGYVETVKGPVPLRDLGFVLPHEHVIVDWGGKDGRSRERYERPDVVETVLPYLQRIADLGVTTFVDCTPPWLGRDVIVLRELSELTGLHIATPTGIYEKTYAPDFAFTASAEELAAFMVRELTGGIEDSGIKPGFIKIGVSNTGPMVDFDRKIVRAACLAHKETRATIHSHTFQGQSALEELDILEQEGVNPAVFKWVHGDFEPDHALNREAARRGCWVEFDSIREDTADERVRRIQMMIEAGYADRVLMSQDRGWYRVGEKDPRSINPYDYLPATFIPLLREKGIPPETITLLTVTNPARSFAVL